MQLLKDYVYATLVSRFIATITILLSCVACSTISITLPNAGPIDAKGVVFAGAAKLDITPPPGFPMGGHSIAGQVSRGNWLRLWARGLFIENPEGKRLVFLSADLWSMPGGLADHVAEIVGKSNSKNCHLGRDEMIIAATHTHQSPGNFSSSSLYNTLGTNTFGFDRDLFEYLATRLANTIIKACESAEVADLHWGTGRVKGLVRNRSINAFLSNPASETDAVLAAGSDLPEGPLPPEYSQDERAYHAVVPSLNALWIISHKDPSRVIGVGAFVAVHPTALTHLAEIYSSDLFGYAATYSEQILGRKSNGYQPVVALFNGAEGDVSPAWTNQHRFDVLHLGALLGNTILETKVNAKPLNVDLEEHFVREPLADVCTKDADGARICTLENVQGGAATLGGAEDGRTWIYTAGCKEGLATHMDDVTGLKQPGFLCQMINTVAHVGVKFLSAPRQVPLGFYRIGPIAFATLPGEFTTIMGKRIRESIARKYQPRGVNVVLIGLSNEYVSYFATPEEYRVQNYEGASTLYGLASGPLMSQYLTELPGITNAPSGASEITLNYQMGLARTFSPSGLLPLNPDSLEENIKDTILGKEKHTVLYRSCWEGPAFKLAEIKNDKNWKATPSVSIEIQEKDGSWRQLTNNGAPENDQGADIIVELAQWDRLHADWCAFWIPPGDQVSGRFRMEITEQNGKRDELEPFSVGSSKQ